MIKGAEMEQSTGATLRETIVAAVDQVEKRDQQVETKTETTAPEVKEAKPESEGRTAGRTRDEKGRLLPGKAEKPEATQDASQATVATPKPRPAYPSTWKKDYAPKWETIDPDLAEEIHRRESDYAKGVSTYKSEYDRIKPLHEAIKPYEQFLNQNGLKAEQAIDSFFRTDQTLRFGPKEEKLRAFAKFAQDYQIPLHELLVQGEDGKVYFNQQYFNSQPQQQQGLTHADVQKLVQQQLAQVQIQTAVQQFAAAKDSSGNPLYPHFSNEKVRQTMDGLLRAGLAQDLPSAYVKALRMPEHSELIQAEENSKRESERLAEQKAKQEQAARAKSAAVSTKSQSPTGMATQATQGRKGLRASLEAAFEQHTDGGRV